MHVHTEPMKCTSTQCRPLSFSGYAAAEDFMGLNGQAGVKRHSSCFTDMRECEQQQMDVRQSTKDTNLNKKRHKIQKLWYSGVI